ncbi:MAG: hypothetical protein ACTSQ8_19190 [Candidatus Helarchaeota archaeon]
MKNIIVAMFLAILISLVIFSFNFKMPNARDLILDDIEKEAERIFGYHMICWNSTVEMEKYLNSLGIENTKISCNVNICQNEEPEEIFYSISHGEMGYYYNGEWFSEEDCLRAHVFNKFIIDGETYYIDITKSNKPFKDRDKYWKCFRY